MAPRRRAVAVAVVLGVLGGAGAAAAAALGVTSEKLTVEAYTGGIPPTTCTLSAATADSYVNQAAVNANFGTATTLDVRSFSANRRTFVRFDLASCSIPASSLITAASLRLFLYSAPAASRTYEARRVMGSWTETGITWSNQPSASSTVTSSVATGTTSNVTLAWTVTADVQAFVDGTSNFGWRVSDQTEGSSPARLGRFRSDEYGTASQRPVLDIAYYP